SSRNGSKHRPARCVLKLQQQLCVLAPPDSTGRAYTLLSCFSVVNRAAASAAALLLEYNRDLMKKLISLFLLFTLVSSQLIAWGPKGHAIVADIAQSRLTPVAKKNLQLLLGSESLASIASWADQIRKERDESYDWHFVDIPKDAPGFSEQRDC